MTIDHINSVLCKVTSTWIEAFNLINHIISPKILGPTDLYYLLVDYLISCLEPQMMLMLGQ